IETIIAGQDHLESAVEFFNAKLSQKTQAAVINAEHRNLRVADQARGGDHRAVATENEYQVSGIRELFRFRLVDRAAGLVLDAFALDLRAADEVDSPLAQPERQIAKSLQRLRLMRF